MNEKRKNIKKTHIITFLMIVALLIIVNVIGTYVFTRFDLTSEKRYSLSDASKDILKNLDDYVYFRVYLEGEFPAGFKKLRRETKEMLDEFRAYSKFIDYEFINPSESDDPAERNETYRILVDQGLSPRDLIEQTNEGREQRIIFPGALVNYRDKEIAVDFLENQLDQSAEDVLNNSSQNLEFKLADAIKKVSTLRKPSIAFIEGHGELSEKEVYDLTQTLNKNYNVERIELGAQIGSLTRRTEPDKNGEIRVLTNYEAIVIAKPTMPFEEKEKFIIDQYIMHGGKVLWLLDPVLASMDSLQMAESTVGVDQNLNLDDQLFKYGVRLNKNLLLDINSVPIPLVTGQSGGQPQMEFFPWYYFPLLSQASDHPLVRNMNAIKGEFVSSIDSTFASGIKKIPLLKTSNYTKISGTPVYITLAMLRDKPTEQMFPSKSQNAAYLLSGNFESLYTNRMPPEILDAEEIGFIDVSKPTSMIVVADGDMAKNQFHNTKGYPLPLGFDQYTKATYGNKDFLINAISYLVDGEGMISIRSRELKIRLLDKLKVNESRLKWQLINILVPLGIVIFFGILLSLLRKRRFTK